MEMAKVSTGVTPSNEIPVTNPDNVRGVYSNNVGASFTQTDFRLFFNEIGTAPDGLATKPRQEIRSIVVLPLQMVAGLMSVLSQISEHLKAEAESTETEQSAK